MENTSPTNGLALRRFATTSALLAGLLLLVLTPPIEAGFNVATSFGTGVQPIGIAAGDLNGDSKPDLVTANSSNNGNGTVSVLLNNGNGTFGSATNLDAGPGSASSVALADFNNDGNLDIVTGKNGSAIRVFIGNGNGTFAAAVPYICGSQPYSLAVADFNGDGNADIATANLNSDDVSILLNKGDGTFATASNSPIGNAPNGIAAGDFNSDGIVDLVVVRQAPAGLSVLVGNGDGTFAAAVTQVLTGAPRAVKVGDFNIDAKPDIAVANDTSPGEVDVLLGVGDGSFGSATAFATGAFPRSLVINEFDGNGKVDLVVPSTSTASADFLGGKGDGTFLAAVTNSAGAGANPNGVTSADFNGDGKPDVATSNYGANTVSVFLNNSATASPAISVNDVQVTEGDAGTINASFTVRLSHPSASTVTVNAATASGTASTGVDYTGIASTPITFNAGVVTQVLNISVKGDTVDEPNETFLLKLSGASNAFIEDAIGVATIIDNDGPPAIHISNTNAVEGDSGVASAVFTLSLAKPSQKTITVGFASADGSGPNAATTADADYFPTANTVSFAPGVLTQTANISIQGDAKVEPNEQVRAVLSAPVNATLANTTGVATIINDDGPNIFATNYTLASESCTVNNVVDPGELVTLSVVLRNFSPAPTTSLVGTLQNTGGVTGASGAQDYGVLSPASPSAARNFTFTVDPNKSPGEELTLTFALSDNGTTVAPADLVIVLSRRESLRENFDSVAATALPAGWVGHISVGQAGDSAWRTIASQAVSVPNAAFGPSQAHLTDNTLTAPAFPCTAPDAQLIFNNSYSFEATFDGAVLEIALNGGAFTEIVAAGGSFVSGGYTGTISVNFGNPLGGKTAWTGDSGGFVPTVVNLPASAAGKSVELRWHLGTDSSTSKAGQFIDDVLVTEGVLPQSCPCAYTCPADVTVSNDPGQCGAIVNLPNGISSGGCGTVVSAPASGSFFPVGTTVVTSTTGSGPNCTFNVTVKDTEAPAITCPGNITQPVDGGGNTAVVNYTVSATENCGGVQVLSTPASGSAFPIGDTSVTSVATDEEGNTAMCSFVVTVTAPATPTPTATATATATPTATPALSLLGNISTRLRVESGNNVLIGGFIITGTEPKKLIVRAIGPSLEANGEPVPGRLEDPVLELYRAGEPSPIETNDNWVEAANKQEIVDSGVAPTNGFESSILTALTPDLYTAVVRGANNSTGVGLVEVYDLDQTVDSRLAQISTRGFVQTGDNVMIGGLYVIGTEAQKVIVRAIGPSLPVEGKLLDPTLELRDKDGALVDANDNWRSDHEQEITDTTVPPSDDAESAVVQTLVPGPYTAIVRGVNDTTGIALVEVYGLGQ